MTYLDAFRERRSRERDALAAEEEAARRAAAVATRVLVEAGARRVWLIGSLPRGTFQPGSDVDFMVEGLTETQIADAARLAAERSGWSVDVLRAESVREDWRAHHERFGVRVHG